MDYTELSKEISYALRYAPWEYVVEDDLIEIIEKS
jgi:hypothetical protein